MELGGRAASNYSRAIGPFIPAGDDDDDDDDVFELEPPRWDPELDSDAEDVVDESGADDIEMEDQELEQDGSNADEGEDLGGGNDHNEEMDEGGDTGEDDEDGLDVDDSDGDGSTEDEGANNLLRAMRANLKTAKRRDPKVKVASKHHGNSTR